MGEEYDVESRISVDDKPARAALLRIAQDFDELYQHAIKTGQAIRGAMSGMRAETKAYATTVAIAKGRMDLLATSTAKVTTAAKPLAGALERANSATVKLGQQGKRTGDVMTGAFNRAGRAGSGLGGVLRTAIGFGAAYVGFNALTSAFRSLVTESFRFQSTIDRNQVSLSAVIAATDAYKDMKDPMAAAGRVGSAVFRQLQGDALKSVATSQELATIYTGIAGPLFNAGAKLSEVRQITNDTVSAASVLGVDFAQASRDINLMATGVAGQDTALFRMLKSTGAIKQTTEEWNKMLPQKRLEAMKTALAAFGPAGKAFEKSLPGITSSFVDFMQRFRGAIMGGPLESVRKMLVRLVDIFGKHQQQILSLLTALGDGFARFLDPALNAFTVATEWFITHWAEIGDRIEGTWKRLQALGGMAMHYAPTLAAGGKAAGAAALVGRVAPGAAAGAYGAISAGLSGGAAAGAGPLSAAISEFVHLISVVAAMGGTLTYLVPIVAIVVGLFAVLADTWSHFVPVLGVIWALFQMLFSSLWGAVSALVGAIMPLLKIIGVVIGSVLALGLVISLVFARLFIAIIGGIFGLLTKLFNFLASCFTWIYEHIVGIFTGILDLIGKAHADVLPKSTDKGGFMADLRLQFDKAMSAFDKQKAEDNTVLGGAEAMAPGTRKTTINDFRGSKIEVKQDFRNANPDNVWLQMLDGVNSAADQRLASALVPDFTR